MTDYESLSRGWDHLGNIERTLGDLQGSGTTINELIQNADDAPGATRMRFTVTENSLEVWNDGVFDRCSDVTSADCEWLGSRNHRCDFHSFRKMASGDKRNRPGTTGAFGVGFTAVYQFTDRPELFSNGEHWIVDEMAAEQDRIQRSRSPVEIDGTTFRLPWAVEHSAFRGRVRQEPVTEAAIDTFIDELRTAIPAAMPFLKELRIIEAVSGSQHLTYKRKIRDGRVSVLDGDGECLEWLVLAGSFAEEAAELKEVHPGVIEDARSSEVRVAIPVGGNAPAGLLYATLPTEEPAHLPVLVQADFVPASDRKRIRFDTSPVSEWNRVAIRAAASVLADNLEAVAEAVGDEAFVDLLLAASSLHKRLEPERIEPAFSAFWQTIATTLPAARVVPIATGGHGTLVSVRLWAEEQELAAAPVLRALGIHLVDDRVRAGWYQLRGDTAIRVLSLVDLVNALRANGLTKRWALSDRTDALSDETGLKALWALLGVLLDIRDRSTKEARDLLEGCAVAPGWDSGIWPVAELYRTDQATQDVLADVDVAATFLDLERLGIDSLRLAEMVQSATPALVLSWVERVFRDDGSDVDEPIRLELLRWFFKRWGELDDSDGERLAQLPIFPTASGPSPLTELALPGDFTDELGLARLVAIDRIEEMRPFLGKLGAQRLTFAGYCTDFVAEAVAEGDLDEDHRRRLLVLLARRLSEVRDDPSVRAALRPLDLIPCTDGKWRPGSDVYLTTSVRPVVGDDVRFAAVPGERRTAHEDLYGWLGAAVEPRPRDVVARCNTLRTGSEGRRQIAQAVIQLVGEQYASKQEWVEAHYAQLRTIPWLPAEGDPHRGHAPASLYTGFRKTLFASQARFLDVSRPVQQKNNDVLNWLGTPSEPTPKQVVDHLLWSAQRDEPVREDMWIYLNQNADAPALDALRDRKCLLIAETNTYVKPSEVYWGWHPFGRFRHQLGPKFAEYQGLLNRLAVAQSPHAADAIEVLQDVASRHGGERAPLIEDDVRVVHACWRLLTEGLEAGTISGAQIAELATAEAVLDQRSWLRRPIEVYFRDSVSLADRFGTDVQDRLIDRPEGLWRALGAAGVRNLSDAVDTRIVEQQPLPPGGVVADRVSGRRRLLVRVLAVDDDGASRRLDAFDGDISLSRLSRLVIQQSLEVGDQPHVSAAYQRGAVFLAGEHLLLYVDGDDGPIWVELARELTRALGVDGDRAANVAAAVKAVLGAESDAAARLELDELGFPALDEVVTEHAEPTVASGLGGSPVSYEDAVPAEVQPGEVPTGPGQSDGSVPTERDGETVDRGRVPTGAADGDDGASSEPTTRAAQPTSEPSAGAQRTPTETADSSSGAIQTRLRSYVLPARPRDTATVDTAEGDADAERAGVDAVLEFERAHGREPEEMPPNNPGYDIRSVDADGNVRIIEVKATAQPWGARGVALSSTQFATAQQRREEFFLYVVDQALTAPRVHPINDPASKVDQYLFDDGWLVVTVKDDDALRPLPPLRLPTSASGLSGAVPFVDPEEESRDAVPSLWVPCEERRRTHDWFAVRIGGDALGLAHRGGIAFVEPVERQPTDDELVLAILHDQIDPDTGRRTTIREWRPERDLAGTQLALRLWSTGSVEPLTVTHPDRIQVRGLVRASLRLSDLEDLGYC